MKTIDLLLPVLLFCAACSTQRKSETSFNITNSNHVIHNEFKPYFDSCGVAGTVVIFDQKKQQWIFSDTVSAKNSYLPASTFKIINLLIALETKTIKDENEMVKWVGNTDTVKYGYRPEIYHDMTVKEAFEVSAGWVFVELAKKIGKERYRKYLAACNYGNLNLSENNDDFWNFGKFAISPINQVAFIKNLYDEKLPFSKHNIEIVKKVMTTEKTNDFTIRAKTGWTRENNMNTGWWVGYIETKNNTYFFATQLLQNRKNNRADFGTCRKEITKKIFRDLGIIGASDEKSETANPLFNAIDHVPIVVNDLEKVKTILEQQLNFTVKEGKAHEGIKNIFVKFRDGTYLEFITPIDSSQNIGKYYTDFLKARQGGTAFAISVVNTDLVKKLLNEKNIQFAYDSNKVWQTLEPEKTDLFFIEYIDKNWKETPKNTAHFNTANSLSAIYMLTDNLDVEAKKYKSLGFAEIAQGVYLQTPYKLFKIGRSYLYLLNGSNSNKINTLLNTNNLKGICGFEIKVNSLQTFNKLLTQNKNVDFESTKTTVYLKDYNLFLIFTE